MASYVSDSHGPVSVGTGPGPTNMFERAFGAPKEPLQHDPYAKHSTHMHDLPRAYQGRSLFLGEVMYQKMANTPNFWTEILPIRETDDLTVTINKWTYDSHVANHQPEESVSRLTTSSYSEETFSFDRKGLALEMEHGFMKTEMGMQQYRAKVVQIIYSIINTMNYDVYVTLLRCAERIIDWNRKYSYFGARNIVDIFEREKFRWAAVQKHEFGMEKVLSGVLEEMEVYGGVADTIVMVPPALAHLNLARSEKNIYNKAGPAGPATVNNFDSNMPVAYIGKSKVYLAKQVTEDTDTTAGMMYRERQIGGYMFMLDTQYGSMDLSEYRSYNRSIKVYDEDSDTMKVLTIDQAIEHCNLFDQEGNLATPGGAGVTGYTDALKGDFLRFDASEGRGEGQWRDVQIFGQMRAEFIDAPIIRAVGQSLSTGIYKSFDNGEKEVNAKLRRGLRILHNLRKQTLTEANLRANMADAMGGSRIGLNMAADTERVMQAPQRIWNVSIPGESFTISTQDASLVTMIGRINWPGLKSLATWASGRSRITRDQQTLVDMVEVVEAIVDHANRLLPGSIGIDEKYSSSSTTESSAYATFVDNLLGLSGFSLWAKPAALEDAEMHGALPTVEEVVDARIIVADDQALTAIATSKAQLGRAREGLLDLVFDRFFALPFTDAVDKIKPTYRRMAERSAFAGMLSTLKYDDDGASVGKFTSFVLDKYPKTSSDVKGFFSALKKADFFNIAQRDQTKLVNAAEKDIFAAIVRDESEDYVLVEMADVVIRGADGEYELRAPAGPIPVRARVPGAFIQPGNVGPVSDDTFYRTPLTLSANQVVTLATARQQGAAWARNYTVSRPGTDDTQAADSNSLYALADHIKKAIRGHQSYDADPNHVFADVAINRFDRTPLARMMKAPLASALSRRGYAQGGRTDAMDVGDSDDALNRVSMAMNVTGYHVTKNLLAQWKMVDNVIGNECERIFARLFLLTPVTKSVLLNMAANNVSLAFLNILVFRPHQRYRASLGIYVKSGAETGNTYVGHMDVMLQDDAAHKTHFGHITFYEKAVVTRPENVYIIHDIFIRGILGGGGITPYRLGPDYNPQANQYGDGSIMYIALPGTERNVPNPLDASGNFSQYNLPGNFDENQLYKTHYSTWARYVALWKWQMGREGSIDAISPIYHPHIGLYEKWGAGVNTLMFRDLTLRFNTVSGKHDEREENTGHWGPIAYETCAQVRRGELSAWDQVPVR